MKYRGYSARIDYDPKDHVFAGRIVGLSEPIEFHGAGVDELRADFEFAVDHYLADCEAFGKKPERQASGRILLRLNAETHVAALVAAQSEGISLNDWLARAIATELGKSP
jgi:predicted HicB family RNase H-like nuclease